MKKSLFEYDNYREFLRDRIDGKLEKGRPTSLRGFAQRAGIASVGYLQYVLNGERNLSVESISKFVRALKLNREEGEFFENLVLFNQAKTSEQKTMFWERMSRSRIYRQLHAVDQKKFQFYTLWYCTVVRELVNSSKFQEDPLWIAQALRPPISAKEAAKALALLLDLGFLKRNKEGKLVQANTSITTGAEVQSLAIVNYHKEMIDLALQSLEATPSQERDISALTLGIREPQLDELLERVRDFRKELVKRFGQNETIDQVYQVNMQLFPLSRNGRSK